MTTDKITVTMTIRKPWVYAMVAYTIVTLGLSKCPKWIAKRMVRID